MRERRAFTLIEMLVVVLIIMVLATIVMVTMYSSKDKANYSRIVSDMEVLAKAARMYESTSDRYPYDVAGGVLPAEMSAYMSSSAMPQPPCGHYDYESDRYVSGSSVLASTYWTGSGITMRKSDAASTFYYYYPLTSNFSHINPTQEPGINILTTTDKSISCAGI
ncbi:MAG: prepilin-type N-terminal cleavage/methylation domain-containing protein [Patescibacteria group bacterium]